MKITYAKGDDWEGLYSDGRLWTEGHSLGITDLINLLVEKKNGEDVEFVEGDVDLDWLDSLGSLPDDILDVVWSEAE